MQGVRVGEGVEVGGGLGSWGGDEEGLERRAVKE